MARLSAQLRVLFVSIGVLLTFMSANSTAAAVRARDAHLKDAKDAERTKHDTPKAPPKAPKKALTEKTRHDFILRAQVWAPTDVSAMDIRMGPQGVGAFAPDEMVVCDYLETKLRGGSRKFECRVGKDDVVKVRYGADNGEVQGAVLASRLLWALGFGADRVYPVRVTCQGCSSDPFKKRGRSTGEQVFEPAAIERKPDGEEMQGEGGQSGWAWPELALVDKAQGGAPMAHRDALTLLAVFLQHTDNKAEQQRLLCLPGGLTPDAWCEKPFLMLHDVGLTFGHANFYNWNDTGSVNFEEWAGTPVWRVASACIGHLSPSNTGTLTNPTIHEAGRAFLAGLLLQLTDGQLRDLFDIARVDRRSRKPNGSAGAPAATVDEWVTAFKRKRDEIVENHCPH